MHVSLNMVNRGVPEERAEICIPNADDISDLRLEKSKYGFEMPLNKKKTVLTRNDAYSVTESNDRLTPHREVFGFVKYGRYSQGSGVSRGEGFVSVSTLLRLTEDDNWRLRYKSGQESGALCLIRSVDSRQYRWAVLNIFKT